MGAYAYVAILLQRSYHDTLVDSRPKALMIITHVDVLFMPYVCFRASSHVALDIEPLAPSYVIALRALHLDCTHSHPVSLYLESKWKYSKKSISAHLLCNWISFHKNWRFRANLEPVRAGAPGSIRSEFHQTMRASVCFPATFYWDKTNCTTSVYSSSLSETPFTIGYLYPKLFSSDNFAFKRPLSRFR